VLRHEPPKRRHCQHYAVVEQPGSTAVQPLDFFDKKTKFRDKTPPLWAMSARAFADGFEPAAWMTPMSSRSSWASLGITTSFWNLKEAVAREPM